MATALIECYNRVVGQAYLKRANYRPSIHIIDCTELEVLLENDRYEGSGVVSGKKKGKEKEEKPRRGYKLGSLRSLLDDGWPNSGS